MTDMTHPDAFSIEAICARTRWGLWENETLSVMRHEWQRSSSEWPDAIIASPKAPVVTGRRSSELPRRATQCVHKLLNSRGPVRKKNNQWKIRLGPVLGSGVWSARSFSWPFFRSMELKS